MPKVLPQAEVGGRRGRGRRVSTSLAEINVIPLVDVMLVLLIIFMVAAPMLQRGVEVSLPVQARSDKMTDVRMYVTVPLSYRQDGRVQVDEELRAARGARGADAAGHAGQGAEGGLPAWRRRRRAPGSDGRLRRAEGRRGRARRDRHRARCAAARGGDDVMDAVSAVLVQRGRDTERLTPLVGWSAVAHVVIVLLAAVVPASWFGARMLDDDPVVMQISLGGAVGPRDGGLATLGGRPVQQEQPIETEEDGRADASTGGQGAGDDRADQDRAEEADPDCQGRGQGPAEPHADEGRESRAGQRRRADRGQAARASACRPAAAAPAVISTSRTSAVPITWRR